MHACFWCNLWCAPQMWNIAEIFIKFGNIAASRSWHATNLRWWLVTGPSPPLRAEHAQCITGTGWFVLCNLCACCVAAKLDFQITSKQWETENLIFFSLIFFPHPLIIIPVYSSGSLSVFFLNVLSECRASLMKPAGSTLRPQWMEKSASRRTPGLEAVGNYG